MTSNLPAPSVLKKYLNVLTYDLPNEDYHGPEFSWAKSSTQFKDLLDDEDVFIEKHIKKTVEKEESAAFDVGTYFHTGILEPHKLKIDCVVFPGKVRRGKDWEIFKAKHKNKAIVSNTQKEQAEGLVRAVKRSPVAQEYLVGKPEVSFFAELNIYRGEIFAPYYGKKLTRNGWVDGPNKRNEKAYVVYVKVRADCLGETFISDLKSTTGNARSNKTMREKISYYQYDVSASLYLDMFSLHLPKVREFIWIFASKDSYNSKTYVASPTNILVGRAKYMKALIKLADCAANDWQSVDYLDTLEPLPYELEVLVEKDIDLL